MIYIYIKASKQVNQSEFEKFHKQVKKKLNNLNETVDN